jgi:hypothetical protein
MVSEAPGMSVGSLFSIQIFLNVSRISSDLSSAARMSDEISRLIKTILDPARPAYSLRIEVLGLKEILLKLASLEVNLTSDISLGETRTDSGRAISPMMAVMCVDDIARTVAFIRGINAAIANMKRRFPGEPVRILYAGCGPLATLAIPQLAIFSLADVSFTLIDINADSIASTRSIIDALGYSTGVEAYFVGDIMSYQIERSREPHIVLIEVMNAALKGEPQVAVARHLMAQAPNTLLLPQSVSVSLELIDQSKEFSFDGQSLERDRMPLGTVFTLDQSSIGSWCDIVDDFLPAATIQLPAFIEDRYTPHLRTSICVFGDHVLGDYDSGLTYPKRLSEYGSFKDGETLNFAYRLGRNPTLVVCK